MRSYDLTDVRLLIIESNETMQKLLRQMAKSLGMSHIQIFTSGREALANIKMIDPDLIIIDWVSKDMSGLDVVRALRTDVSPNPFIAIIMMSGLSSVESIVKARDSGINEFLGKPISPKSLYEKICHVLERPRPFVRCGDFFGPDRRRKQIKAYGHLDRRKNLAN